LNRIVRLPLSATADAGTGSPTNPVFAFNVFDPDVEQALQFKVFIDLSPVAAVESTIPSTGHDRRAASFTINTADLGGRNGCHRVQLFVSNQFMFGSVQPVQDHDVATATWWIQWQPDSAGTGVEMGECLP
jgi:hypothetical protein